MLVDRGPGAGRGHVAVRSRTGGDLGARSIDAFIADAHGRDCARDGASSLTRNG